MPITKRTPKDEVQSSDVFRTYSAGAQDLASEGPNDGRAPRAVFYKGAMTVTDATGASVVMIPVSDYTLYPAQVRTVVSSANDYQILW